MINELFRMVIARRVALAFASIWVVAAPAWAVPEHGLADLLALADSSNPVLAVARGQRLVAEAARDTAAAYPNPELELSSGRYQARVEGARGGVVEALSLSQPVELPALRSARGRAAQAGVEGAEAGVESVRRDQHARIKLAFFEVLRRREEARIAEDGRQLLEQIRNRVGVKVEVGEAPRYELIKAEAELLAAASAAASARLRVDEAKAVLRAAVGAALEAPFEVAGEFPVVGAIPSLAQLAQAMQQGHPALRQAQAETQRAQARVGAERAQRVPQPTLRAGVERDPEISQWRVGFSLPLPLWNQRQGPVGEAVGALHQAEALQRQQQLALTEELESAYVRLQIATSQQEAFDGGLLKQAQAALMVAEAAYRFGERGILDYLDAQRTLRAVRSDAIQTRFSLLAAATDIERLSGFDLLGVKP